MIKDPEDEEFERIEKAQQLNGLNKHICTACSCDYDDDEGGIQGYFGILEMSFCPTCLSSIFDMVEQLNPREWNGLTDEELHEVAWTYGNETMQALVKHAMLQAENILKEKNYEGLS